MTSTNSHSHSISKLFNTSDENLSLELLSTCKIHNLPPEELYFKWESFILNNSIDKNLNVSNLRNFKLQLRSEATQSTPVKNHSLNLKKRVNQQSTPLKSTQSNQSPLTPSNHSNDSTPKPTHNHFALRKNPDLIVNTFNGHLNLAPKYSGLEPRVNLMSAVSLNKFKYRYMFEKLSERSAVLDERIDYFANRVKDLFKGEPNFEIGDPSIVNMVCFILRISLTNPTSSHKESVSEEFAKKVT